MLANEKKKIAISDIIYIALFSALIAICSWISIPLAIPITMQTFAVFVTAGLLGARRGTMSVLLYILLGAVGLPVFSGFTGGFGILLGNTGGYIIGFIFTSLIIGLIADRMEKKVPVMIIAMILGLLVCYAFGTAWFMFFYAKTSGAVGLMTTLSWCVIPFIIPDAVKIALAILIINRVSKHVKI